MLTSSDFEKQADAAHAAVAEMTWNNFVERFLELLKSSINMLSIIICSVDKQRLSNIQRNVAETIGDGVKI